MKTKLNRREFLQLAGAYSMGAFAPQLFMKPGVISKDSGQKNILIILFDALSAYHMSPYGYSRDTMPNLNRLANKAIVYHNHYSAGNYTTPGTASLLTGVLPWNHRALERNVTVSEDFVHRNIFSEFSGYHRIAYTHNPYVDTMLKHLFQGEKGLIPKERFLLESNTLFSFLFSNDDDIASVSWIQALEQVDDGFSYSLFISKFFNTIEKLKELRFKDLKQNFPRGFPSSRDQKYILEPVIDYLIASMADWEQPFLGYFHLLPPHHPYNPRKEFVGKFFEDGFDAKLKTSHVFVEDKSAEDLKTWRSHYDEFISYVDVEFAKLYDFMDREGWLENSWLILTSDHGELFDFGIRGHDTPLMYQPLLRVPLLIFEPGRTSRLDVLENTNAIDILPTLLKVNEHLVPDWIDGEILQPFSKIKSTGRNIYAIESKKTEMEKPIEVGTIALIRGNLKMIYYLGYDELGEIGEMIELYDIETDPAENNNLFSQNSDLGHDMLNTIKAKLEEANSPYL